eukprot:6188-Chlamydomonas_euryale.AAC.2
MQRSAIDVCVFEVEEQSASGWMQRCRKRGGVHAALGNRTCVGLRLRNRARVDGCDGAGRVGGPGPNKLSYSVSAGEGGMGRVFMARRMEDPIHAGLQACSSLSIQDPMHAGLQACNSLGIQDPMHAGLQACSSLGIQDPMHAGLQACSSPGVKGLRSAWFKAHKVEDLRLDAGAITAKQTRRCRVHARTFWMSLNSIWTPLDAASARACTSVCCASST